MASAAVLRLPPRLRAMPGLVELTSPLDALLSSRAIDARRHAAGVAYRDLRARFEAVCRSARRGGPGAMPEAAWFSLKARHAALIEAAGFDRFLLDRLLLDGEAPLRCEVGRVAEALGRVVQNQQC